METCGFENCFQMHFNLFFFSSLALCIFFHTKSIRELSTGGYDSVPPEFFSQGFYTVKLYLANVKIKTQQEQKYQLFQPNMLRAQLFTWAIIPYIVKNLIISLQERSTYKHGQTPEHLNE